MFDFHPQAACNQFAFMSGSRSAGASATTNNLLGGMPCMPLGYILSASGSQLWAYTMQYTGQQHHMVDVGCQSTSPVLPSRTQATTAAKCEALETLGLHVIQFKTHLCMHHLCTALSNSVYAPLMTVLWWPWSIDGHWFLQGSCGHSLI